jgi:uncharacterized membrane protein YgcG
MTGALLAALAVAGCSPAPALSESADRAGETEEGITKGTVDTGDPAVVMLYAIKDDQTNGAICTATVVSPHVVATAAHCVSPEILGAAFGTDKYHFVVFLGSDNNDPAQYNDPANFVPVESTFFDPGFHATDSPPVHDVGAAVTKTALTISPIPINRTALSPEWIGKEARIVGYGRLSADSGNSSGTRRQAFISILAINPGTLTFGKGGPETCEGDSGGPLLISRNGVESLAGVHSYGNSKTCSGTSFEMRADVDLVALIDPIVAASDPGFVPPEDGGSGGSGGSSTGSSSSVGSSSSGGGSGGSGGSGGGDEPSGGPKMDDSSGCAVRTGGKAGGWLSVMALASVVMSVGTRRHRRPRRR